MPAAGQAMAASDRAAPGDSGIRSFFEEHKRRTYQFAFQLTGNADDAMDIVQEAFLRLHRQPDRLSVDPQHAVRWLFRAVRNLAIDMLRSRSARPQCEIPEDLADARQPAPDESAIGSEVSARLWAEIARLPLPEREALLLRDWQGMPYADIAELTGTTVSTVTSRIHEARTTLRQRLRRYL